jgi:polyisoprenoid-binding protein YceI
MKYSFLASVLFFTLMVLGDNGYAQLYVADGGVITFYSSAPLEDIQASNGKVSSIFNTVTGDIAFSVPINQFEFKKKLMQEHFNDKYMESDKYPRATFSGKVTGFDPERTSAQQVTARGKLTIHGITREVVIPGTVERHAERLRIFTRFMVKLEDYQVKIPRLMWQNIAEEVEVTVDVEYKLQQ